MPQRTFLMMLIVICVTILCFVWMVRDSLCVLRLQQGNTVLVATLAVSASFKPSFAFLSCFRY
ncbi:Hok/Gef family protein [Salmonella enterica subsp. enterica serovar Typhimurium]|nr:Hok/Gef family protein [Salmonella enterica subsp. enterica serovar Typhimurium]